MFRHLATFAIGLVAATLMVAFSAPVESSFIPTPEPEPLPLDSLLIDAGTSEDCDCEEYVEEYEEPYCEVLATGESFCSTRSRRILRMRCRDLETQQERERELQSWDQRWESTDPSSLTYEELWYLQGFDKAAEDLQKELEELEDDLESDW